MNLKKIITFSILVILLNYVQVITRSYFNFYEGATFVSILIGGYIGLFSGVIVTYLED